MSQNVSSEAVKIGALRVKCDCIAVHLDLQVDAVVVYSLFIVASIVCWSFVLGPCSVMWFLVSILQCSLAIILKRNRELVALI